MCVLPSHEYNKLIIALISLVEEADTERDELLQEQQEMIGICWTVYLRINEESNPPPKSILPLQKYLYNLLHPLLLGVQADLYSTDKFNTAMRER